MLPLKLLSVVNVMPVEAVTTETLPKSVMVGGVYVARWSWFFM